MAYASPAHQPFLQASRPVQAARAVVKRRLPYGEFAVHSLALSVIVVLFWANQKEQFWKDFKLSDTRIRNELKGWQFAAKLHELVMLSSLSFVVFYYMRRLLLGRSGIPFGLVSVTYTIAPSVFLGKPFWKGLPLRLPFGMLVAVACLLSVLLGPSSAITMIPALGWFETRNQDWDHNSKIAYITGPDEFWRTAFNGSISGNTTDDLRCLSDPYLTSIRCPSSGFPDIFEWFVGATYTDARNTPTFNDIFSSAKRAVSVGINPRWEDAETISTRTGVTVTVITDLTALTLGTLYNYATRKNVAGIRDVLYPRFRIADSTPTYQPVVQVNCHMNLLREDPKLRNATFPSMRSPWLDDAAYSNDPFFLNSDDPIWDGLPAVQARFKWFKDTRDVASSSLLALAIVPVEATNDTVASFQSSAVAACSVDARWAKSAAYFEPRNSTAVSSNVTDYLTSSLDSWYRSENRAKYALSESPLDLGLDWAAYLNAKTNITNNDNSTDGFAISYMLSAPISKRENNITSYMAPNITTTSLNGAIEESVATLIGTIVTDGIARTADFRRQVPLLYTDSAGQNATFTTLWNFINDDDSYTGLTAKYVLQVKLDQYGYGYGFRSVSSWAAMGALLVYALIILVHILWVSMMHMRKRHLGSDGWDTVGDILALAMNSAPSASLYGTSGGIDNGGTWQEIVKIRETGDEHLELQFDADKQSGAGERVAVGKKYY